MRLTSGIRYPENFTICASSPNAHLQPILLFSTGCQQRALIAKRRRVQVSGPYSAACQVTVQEPSLLIFRRLTDFCLAIEVVAPALTESLHGLSVPKRALVA